MIVDPLAELLLTPAVPDPPRVVGAILTAYDQTTGRCTVTDGIVTWTDLSVIGLGARPALALGRVALLRTTARPIILGNLFTPEAI